MATPVPSGFSAANVIAGLHKAMAFGAPNEDSDQATFVMPQTILSTTGPLDDENVPFNPSVTPVKSTISRRTVPCAYEYVDAQGKIENLGIINPSRVKITLLDDDYQEVKGFDYVVIGGQKYLYRKTEPPVALGSIDVWTVYCQAEDES